MPIDKLNLHYSFTEPATVYDEEAMTSLELAGRQGAKINEIIDDQNKLHDETAQTLKNYDDKIKNDLPQQVTKEVNAHIQNGDFIKAINEYARDLEGRVDSLIGQTQAGSISSMDAEVIDGRTDFKGTTWQNIGAHIREITKELDDNVNSLLTDTFQQIEAVEVGGWYGVPNSGNDGWQMASHGHASIPVQTGETYLVKCSYGWSIAGIVFMDASDKYISHMLWSPDARTYEQYTTPVIVPARATTMHVQTLSHWEIGVRKLVGTRPVVDDVYIDNIIQSVAPQTPILETKTGATYKHTLLYQNELTDYTHPSGEQAKADKFTVHELVVNRGERYRISGTGSYGNDHYMIVDLLGNVLESVLNIDDGTMKSFTYDITIPSEGAKLYVSGHDDLQPALIQLMKGNPNNTHNLSHLKWVCLGDSLTEVNTRTSKRYYEYVQDKTGIQVVNMGASGTGYKNSEEGDGAFYQRALNMPTDADVITIFGSGNDLSHTLGNPTDTGTSTICGCINKTIDNILSINPTIQIGIVAPTPWINNTPQNNGSMARYTEALQSIAKMRGIPFLDLFHESGLRPNDATFRTLAYSKDDGNGVHPNEIGHKMISGRFYELIQKLVGTY